MKKISFIIPCFNEEKNVLIIYDKIKKIYQQQNYEVEIIFIDDGSSDNTLYELKQIKDSDKKISAKIISFSRNFGKDSAIYAGLKNSTGDYSVIIDADFRGK